MELKEKDRKFLKTLGANIRKARFEKDISQEELADRAGLDRTYIPGVENGKRNISIITLQKLADALSVNYIELLNGKSK